MASREHFGGPVTGVACPLCSSRSYTIVSRRDPGRGLVQTLYRCEGCKSYFGDPKQSAPGADDEPSD
jgi:DNA-directed RNA polymerase subunit RPC12/RpoP